MDQARRRALLGASSVGKVVLRDEDRQSAADYERAAAQVRARHPLLGSRRQQLLSSSGLGKAVLQHEQELRAR